MAHRVLDCGVCARSLILSGTRTRLFLQGCRAFEASRSPEDYVCGKDALVKPSALLLPSHLCAGSCSKISYEQLPDHVLPCNFIAVGDSTMRLNPVFGEGVSKCAVGAVTLDGLLRTLPGGPTNTSFARAYFTRLDNRTRHLWYACSIKDWAQS